MPLQVVVAVKTSWALVALAWFVVWVGRPWPGVHAVHLMLHSGMWVALHRDLANHHLSIRTVNAVLQELSRQAREIIAVVLRTIHAP